MRPVVELMPQLRRSLPQADAFDAVFGLQGEDYRSHKHRRTFKTTIGNVPCFVKLHGHTSWGEILKNAARLRWPTLTALPEWNALHRLHELGVPTMKPLGFGVRGVFPAWLQSFLITESLENFVHLDEAVSSWRALPTSQQARLKFRAIHELANIVRRLHSDGMNHRDCYLCHFMLPKRDFASVSRDDSLHLHIIDLHRVQRRVHTPQRWAAKDVAGILFSSLDVHPTSLDCIRFLRAYWGDHWRQAFRGQTRWLRSVRSRAIRVYRGDYGKSPQLPRRLANF